MNLLSDDRKPTGLPRYSRRSSKAAGGAARVSLMTFFAVIFTLFVMTGDSVFGQLPGYGRITLDQEDRYYDILPKARYIEETSKTLTSREVQSLFDAGRFAQPFSSPIARMTGATHWVAFDIRNQSRVNDWVMTFGDQNRGRFGLPQEVTIYNVTSGAMLVDVRQNKERDVHAAGATRDAVPLMIPRGESVSILMRITPDSHVPLFFRLGIEPSSRYAEASSGWGSTSHMVDSFFVLMLGFFAASILLRRDFSLGLFVGFVLLQYLGYSIAERSFYSGSDYAGLLKPLFLGGSAILGLFLSRQFLQLNRDDTNQTRIFIVAGVVSLLALLSGLFVFSGASLIGVFLTYLPLVLVPLVVIMASLGTMQANSYATMAFSVGWVAAFVSSMITILAVTGLTDASDFKLFALWAGAIVQDICFVVAVLARQIMDDRERQVAAIEAEEDMRDIKTLGRSKTEAENKRLLKLIKHEREVMNELREREIEQNTETRRAREAAEEANRAKSAFLAVISHEIRTPMTGVLGMARLLIQEQLTKKQNDYAQTIKDSGEAMVSLLNDILDFEKIESNNLDLETTDFDLPRLLNGVITLMSGHAGAKNISLDHEIDPSVPNIVVGDSVRLRQILLNLVGNAIKFTEKGGVTLIVKRQQDAAHKGSDQQKIMFAIKDTGIGISDEAKKNLFNPFSQADSSITRKFGGTGLGLAISQRLVEAMGGKIEIDSVEGEGSTFFFYLSLNAGDEARATEREEAAAAGHDHKTPDKAMAVLVVEDNEVNQKLLIELLRRLGHTPVVAGTGEDGIAQLEQNHFDMVFMDVHLPGISGMGATKTIRTLADREKAAIPIVALTGNVASEDIAACYAANMNGYLSKPVDPSDLEKAIGKVMRGELDNPVELQEPQATKSGYKDPSVKSDSGPAQKQADPQDVADDFLSELPLEDNSDEVTPERDLSPFPEVVEDEAGEDDGGSDGEGDNGSASGASLLDPPSSARGDEAQTEAQAAVETDMVRAMAADLENFNFDEDDLDLDEDSFAAAIEIGESQEKATVNGFERADVLDPSILDNLRRSIGHDKLEDMLSEMFMKLDELSQTMRKAAASGDRESFQRRAHELKGMSANFGLQQIRVLLMAAETAIKNGEDIDFEDVLVKLSSAEDAAKSALQQWVGASAEL